MSLRTLALVSAVLACLAAAACTTDGSEDADPAAANATSVAVPRDFWSVNGEVQALALSGDTLYVGGDFSSISPRTGPLLASSRTGARRVDFPRVASGVVNTVVDDGHGGWFVGGEFDQVGGVRCANLVHITRELQVKNWCPSPRGEVTTLARRGATLYVGGTLERIGGKKRRTLAAVDTATGRTLDWNPDPGYFVADLEVDGRTVYVLGSFREIGGERHGSLAAVDAITGDVREWDPRPPFDDHGDSLVQDITVGDSVVYAGGSILVAYDKRTGARTPWDPLAGDRGYVAALDVSNERLYVGGTFSALAGERRSNLAAFDTRTGELSTWRPSAEPVSELTVQGLRVVVADPNGLSAFHAGTGDRLPFADPKPNGPVHALAASPSTIVAGGLFDGASGVGRTGLAAIDVRTGEPTPWNPRLGGGDPRSVVYAIATDGATIYVGGIFQTVGDLPRSTLAGIDATTARASDFAPSVSGYSVDSLALADGRLYVGGDFETVDAQVRTGNAAFDVVSAGLLEWYPAAGHMPVVVEGERVFLGGESVAAVDTDTGSDIAWEIDLEIFRVPSADAIAVADGTVYFGGFFEAAAGEARTGLAAVDADSGEMKDWSPEVDSSDFIRAIAVREDMAFVGGFFGLRRIHRETGAIVGTYPQLTDIRVDALIVTENTIFVGTERGLVVVPSAQD